jgi:hypothetical protein
MQCQLILVIGYGFLDLHINSWIREARLRKVPLSFADRWDSDLLDTDVPFSRQSRLIESVLRINLRCAVRMANHQQLILVPGAQAAIWDGGFRSLLSHLRDVEPLEDIVQRISTGRSS